MEYRDPYSALGEGITRGLSLATSIAQIKQQKRQQAWENDIKQMTLGIQIAKEAGPKHLEFVADTVNKTVKPLWDKWNPKNPFPKLTATNQATVFPMMDQIYDVQQKVRDGKMKPELGFSLASTAVSKGWQQLQGEAEERQRYDEMTGAVMKDLEERTKTGRDRDKQGEDATGKALMRITQLGTSYVNLMKGGQLDPELAADPKFAPFAALMAQGKATPDQIQAVGEIINNERNYLASQIPDQYRPKAITSDEYKFLTEVKKYDPGSVMLKYTIQPSAPRRAPAAVPASIPAAMPAAAAIPAALPAAAPALTPAAAPAPTPPLVPVGNSAVPAAAPSLRLY